MFNFSKKTFFGDLKKCNSNSNFGSIRSQKHADLILQKNIKKYLYKQLGLDKIEIEINKLEDKVRKCNFVIPDISWRQNFTTWTIISPLEHKVKNIEFILNKHHSDSFNFGINVNNDNLDSNLIKNLIKNLVIGAGIGIGINKFIIMPRIVKYIEKRKYKLIIKIDELNKKIKFLCKSNLKFGFKKYYNNLSPIKKRKLKKIGKRIAIAGAAIGSLALIHHARKKSKSKQNNQSNQSNQSKQSEEYNDSDEEYYRREREQEQKEIQEALNYFENPSLKIMDTSNENKVITKLYRKSARKLHPDKGGDPEKFKELGKYYKLLTDAGYYFGSKKFKV